MKNIFGMVVCFMLTISTIVIGNSESDIYFCHRDADFKPEIFLKEKRDIEDDLSNNEVRNISIGLAKPIYYARHCFFLIADKVQEYKQPNKILVNLDGMDTIGYGKIGRIAKDVGRGGEGTSYMHTNLYPVWLL